MRASRGDRAVLWVVFGGALLYSAITAALGAIRSYVTFVAAGETPVALFASQEVPTGLGGSAAIVSGSFTDAALVVTGLSDGVRALLGTGAVLATLTSLAVSLAVAYFLWALLKERPFRASVTVAAMIAGGALLLGGLLHQAVTGFGTMQAAVELDPEGAVFDIGMWFDLTPLFGGFAIMALGFAFQLGERLQRETDGLV